MKFLYLWLLVLIASLHAQKYELGQGYVLHEYINIGGYFSIDYANGENIDKARLDDVAILAYGKLPKDFSYFIELEAAPFYEKDFLADTSQKNTTFHYERAYANYDYSNSVNFRAGKFITPIGYWNLVPINVLRDTSSNPLFSYRMFPKFVTGVESYGYTSEESDLKYNLFIQVTDDIDEEYINIKNNLFFGGSIEYFADDTFSFGGSLAYFETKEIRKNVGLLQVNAKYDWYPFLIQAEWGYTNIDNTQTDRSEYQLGGYLQGMYNFTEQHALVGRYEYFKDTQLGELADEHIALFGYSYRPAYAFSLKGEYQFHDDKNANKALLSLSVLF